MTELIEWSLAKRLFGRVCGQKKPFPDQDYSALYEDIAAAYAEFLSADDSVLAAVPFRARRVYLERIDHRIRGLLFALNRQLVPGSLPGQSARAQAQLWGSKEASAMAATLTTQLDVVTAIVSEKLEAEPDIDQTLPAARRDFLGQLANIYFQYFQREPRFSVKAGRADGPFARFVEITLEEFPVPGGCSMSQANRDFRSLKHTQGHIALLFQKWQTTQIKH